MPNLLELRLHQLSIDFARQIAGIIRGMTIEDLAALHGEDDAPEPKPKTRRKTRPAPEPARKKRTAPVRKTTRKRTVTQPTTKAAVTTPSTGSTVSTEPPPPPTPAPPQSRHVPAEALAKAGSPQGDGGLPPADHAAAFRRAEQERMETAVVKFVSQNPATDAEVVAVRLGLPKGKTQALLDDLVLRGKLRMKSGQHGRCYVVVE